MQLINALDFTKVDYYWSVDLDDALYYFDKISLEDEQSTVSSVKENDNVISTVQKHLDLSYVLRESFCPYINVTLAY